MARSAPSLPGPIDPQLPQDYQRVRLDAFDGGMDTSIEPERLAPNKLLYAKNVYWYDGQLLVDSGYAQFGGSGILLGSPQVAFQAFFPDGTATLLLLTTSTLYILAGSPPQWQFARFGGKSTLTSASAVGGAGAIVVTNPAIFFTGASITILQNNNVPFNTTVSSVTGSTINFSPTIPSGTGVNANAWVSVNYVAPTLTSALAAGATTVPLSNTQGISVGSWLGVQLSNGQQWQFKVGAIVGLNITPAGGAACPAPGANNLAAVVVAPTYNGSLSIQAVFTSFPLGPVIFCNGVDPIQVYHEVGQVVSQLAGLPDNTTCEAMNIAHEQLLIANLVENGVELPQRLRASDAADPNGWIPGQNGIAAVYDLLDTEDFILSINLLGPWVIVYRETTIMRGSYLGLPLQTWYWEYMVYGEGVQSQQSVSELGEEHFIVGTQNVYLYSGGYDLEAIGDPIWSQLLSAKGNLNAKAKSTIFTQYVSDQDEVWLFYPTGTNSLPDTMLRCSLEKKSWYIRNFANTFVSAGFFLPLQIITWATALGTWAQNTAAWNSRVFLQNAAVIILCDPITNQTFVYDYNTLGDNGVPIQWQLQIRDIGDGDSVMRWDTLVLFGSGNGIEVSYALDPTSDPFSSGIQTPFVSIRTPDGLDNPVNFGVGKSRQRLTFDAASTWIRTQITGNDPNFTLSYAEFWFTFESEW